MCLSFLHAVARGKRASGKATIDLEASVTEEKLVLDQFRMGKRLGNSALRVHKIRTDEGEGEKTRKSSGAR